MFKKADTMTFITNELGDVRGGGSNEVVAKIRDGDTVLETALKNKISLDSSCLEGTCGTCRVIVVAAPSELCSPGEIESETRSERAFNKNERLACQMPACPGLKVRIP